MRKISLTLNGIVFDEVAVAENYPEMEIGLDKLESPSEKSGLFYVFEKPGKYRFNNDNPNVPIDLLMLDENGVIVGTRTLQPNEQDAEPESPFLYALEITGGMAAKIGLKKGMTAGMDLDSLEIFRNSINCRSRIAPANLELPDGWLESARQEIRRRDGLGNDLFDMNIALVGAKYDLGLLRSQGWKDLGESMSAAPYIHANGVWGWDAPPSKTSGMWMECDFGHCGSRFIFRLYCSNLGHFRYMYAVELDKAGGFCEKASGKLPAPLKKRVLGEFRGALVKPAAKDIGEELEWVTEKLTNPSIPDDWDERRRRLCLWTHEFDRLREESPYYCHRLLNGMLRFGHICEDEDILTDTVRQALLMGYEPGTIRLLDIILRRPVIKTAALWNIVGCAFDGIGMKEEALFCFISAWRKQYSEHFGQNIWILGAQLLPEYFKRRDKGKAALVADAMLASVAEDVEPKKYAEVLCALGMTYEMEENVQMTLECYSSALSVYCSGRTEEARRKDKDAEAYDRTQTFHDHPLLFQSVFRVTMHDPDARRRQLERQLDCYPDVPDSKGMGGNVPVSYIEGYGMGDLWNAVAPGILDDNPEGVIKMAVENGKPYGESRNLPEYACGGALLEKSVGLSYEKTDEKASPLFSLCLLGLPSNDKKPTVISCMPAFRPGNGWRLKAAINSVSIWNNAVEASAEFQLCEGHNLECYLQDYGVRDYTLKSDRSYEMEIAVFGYGMSRFRGQEFDIDKGPMLEEEKRRLRKEGKDDNIASVKVVMPEDTCMIHRSLSGWKHDVSIIARIERMDDFVFMGRKCVKFTLAFDERGGDAKLPLFMARETCGEYVPAVGDCVECQGWLQGIVLGEAGDKEENGENQKDEENHDWTISFLLASMGKNAELDVMAESAVGRRDGVENIVRFHDALPSDPAFSCTVNGNSIFVKVLTGYFDTEEACRQAVRRALLATPWRWHGCECRLAAVVGIRSQSDSDGYHIVYLGMAGEGDWRVNLYDYLGVKPANLRYMNEDKPIKINGRETPVSNVWHWKYDFMGIRNSPQDNEARMALAQKVLNAWKKLDASAFDEILAEDGFTYGSYWVKDTMRGKAAYRNYIEGKFASIARTDSVPEVSMVRLLEGISPQEFPFALHMRQGDHSTLLTFEFNDVCVSGMYMTDPDIYAFETL